MLVTTIGALAYQIRGFLTAEQPKIMLATIAAVLIALTLFILHSSLTAIKGLGVTSRHSTN